MKTPGPDFYALTQAARRYAALQDAFAPEAAVKAAMGDRATTDPILAARVLSSLRKECTVARGKTGEMWLMRPGARRKTLGGASSATDWIAESAAPAATPVQAALAGQGDFAPEALDAMIAGGEGPERLGAVAVALDRAGPSAPGFGRLVQIRSALNAARAEARTDVLLAGGFFGREAELARLADWIAHPQEKPPLRTVHVSGLPGIGKSYLLEQVIQMARLDHRPILVILDFDRSGLNVLDAHGFFEEISRQIGDALPEAAGRLRDMRLRSAERRATETGSTARASLPRELLDAMGKAVAASGRRVLAVLDTLEVLRSRGETQVMTLFDHFDLLGEYGLRPLVLISAGRGDALDPVRTRSGHAVERVEAEIRLDGLEDSAARLLLETRGVPKSLWPRIMPLAQGIPLLLTLAAKALTEAEFDESALPPGASAATIGGYLYRAILSRVPERLRRIANEGLVLRATDPETLRAVVAPALGLTLTPDEARADLQTLATHHWLVEHDRGDWIRHRSDVRRAFLPLLYDAAVGNRDVTEAINLRAADWFATRDPLTALYHRLQLTRFGHPMPEVPADLAPGFTETLLDELPDRARDHVLQRQGRRTSVARGDTGVKGAAATVATPRTKRAAPAPASGAARFMVDPARMRLVPAGADEADAPPPDERAVRDLELMLEKGDLREAGHILAQGYEGSFAASDRAGLVAVSYLWLSGRWSAARAVHRRLEEADLARAMVDSPHLTGRLLLEMTAEFAFARAVRFLRWDRGAELARISYEGSTRTGMVGGALDFAFLATGLGPEELPRRLDLARSLLAAGMDPEAGADVAGLALSSAASARRGFGLFYEPTAAGGPDDRAAGFRAEALQSLNPYGALLHVLVSGDGADDGLMPYLADLRPNLPRAAALFLPDLEGADALPEQLRSGPPDVVAALTAMGLAGDWPSGYALAHRGADLRLIALAAERWRRTVAGHWAYGRIRPAGWTGVGETDLISAERLRRLEAAADPVGGALAQIHFWEEPWGAPVAGRRAAPAVLRRLDGFAAKAARDLNDETTVRPEAALAALLKAGAPGVVAVPLAVFMSRGLTPAEVLGGAKPD